MSQSFSTDVLIVGAGIAGLWLNARLRRLGFATALLDSAAIGSGQSGKSQGIIHGGTKYALQGVLTPSAQAIAAMPGRFRAALAGEGELDLRDVRVLSQAHYLWSPGSLAGNLTSFFASRAMRSRIAAVTGEALPPALQNPAFAGKVYRLDELVLDVLSLLSCLTRLSGDSLLSAQDIQPLTDENGEPCGLQLDGQALHARCIVLCAGAGNQALLERFALTQPAQQSRPLHMVLVKSAQLSPLYAHCLGAGSKPRLTITSHPLADGQWLWYLGGELAEANGVARDQAAQIHAARQELTRLLPWLNWSDAQFACLRVSRAEPAQSGLLRPDNAFLATQGRLLVGWPTKLALAPDFADRVLKHLKQMQITPSAHNPLPPLPKPPLAPPFWHGLLS
ncbi:FAD-dependent oxidoreductase [Ventosimonas gracilis]|uniref:FAD-dependent oxidoreductase n=1 Tax=Ventosimonas gracilis TaxID=1680762 RepID=A0A139SPD7_9GAMM|nr:FAD-dependent oxidoreductase [Ventosimonas gracilis]KXU36448.1 FAD-dependent oxidoreductase [Ventosimonas gracilis]